MPWLISSTTRNGDFANSWSDIRYRIVDTARSPPDCRWPVRSCSCSVSLKTWKGTPPKMLVVGVGVHKHLYDQKRSHLNLTRISIPHCSKFSCSLIVTSPVQSISVINCQWMLQTIVYISAATHPGMLLKTWHWSFLLESVILAPISSERQVYLILSPVTRISLRLPYPQLCNVGINGIQSSFSVYHVAL